MVLTNFELWAADGSSGSNLPLDFESNNPHTRHLNPFDPRVVPQLNSNLNNLSSNGYYGFSYVNAAHDNNNNNNNNNNNTSNNNNSTTYNFMANNDVNGMKNTFKTTAPTTTRCKKRFFVMNDDVGAAAAASVGDCSAANNNSNTYYSNNYEVSAKRCRFDDDFSAQYCNDFFQLPSTQIATQSCLMDTEEGFENNNNNNNIEKYDQETFNPQLQTFTAHHQQQQLNSQQQLQTQQQHQPQQQQQHLYHQQQHYQDIQFATIKCHFNHNNNSCDTLALNSHTCKIDLEKNTENVLNIHKPNPNNSIQSENDKYDNDVANDFKVDDATLFAQLHGGCLHHHDHLCNSTVSSSSGDYTVKNYPMNHQLPDENYYEEF